MVIPKIDQNDPLYIRPSDASGAVLIPIKLIGSENYGIWSRSMRIVLLGKRKFGFMTRACTKGLYNEELHEQWETCNVNVLSWLMNIVSEDLLNGIVYATTAFSVWADLKERFDKVNRMRIYQLHREITTLTQVQTLYHITSLN